MREAYRYLFGPLYSRRLGRSLGVDLVPAKTCTADCSYCEVGLTTCRTLERQEYVPVTEVIAELRRWLQGGGSADVLALSGSGEPTLHQRFGDVLRAARDVCHLRRVVLSNGMLLWRPDVRREAQATEIFKATLSAWDEASFVRVHRPHPDLTFAQVFDGLRAFREDFSGALWLEVFLVQGVNDTNEAVEAIADCARRVRPDRIHLNTVVRPPADPAARPVEPDRLAAWAAYFDPPAQIASVPLQTEMGATAPGGEPSADEIERLVKDTLRRRGCRPEELASGMGIRLDLIRQILARLVARGEVQLDRKGSAGYYEWIAE